MGDTRNEILHGDCIKRMNALEAGSVDLAFADPPFNIGYDYDVYDDSVEHQQYVDWSSRWITAVHRVLKPDGTFWLAIGDEYAAELKLESQRVGFHCRSWVVWYYTFGVNCKNKFTRSHAHLFYFVKDRADFTFLGEDPENRVPSARELIYNDKRANPKGRLPDDTWIIRPAGAIGELADDGNEGWSPQFEPPADTDRTFALRPQQLEECFNASEDTWYFPRVAGTFKERAGFHGCQMPEQLLGRIIRTCSRPGELVLDPFSGSATTLAVAKKLGRSYVGFDLSKDYVKYGHQRLAAIRVGDRLDGTAEPTKSPLGRAVRRRKQDTAGAAQEQKAFEQRFDDNQLRLTKLGIKDAFRRTHDGYSADRVVADAELNREFTAACERLGIVGEARTWNSLLFRLRKQGELADIETARRTTISWEDCDHYLFASEIALQRLLDEGAAGSLDEILCDPELAARFDESAGRLAPGFRPLEYRWAALKLRKQAKKARSRAAVLTPPKRLSEMVPLAEVAWSHVPASPGLYLLSESRAQKLYVGEAANLRASLKFQFGSREKRGEWQRIAPRIQIQTLALDYAAAGRLAWQSCLVKKYKQRPRLNYFELCSA